MIRKIRTFLLECGLSFGIIWLEIHEQLCRNVDNCSELHDHKNTNNCGVIWIIVRNFIIKKHEQFYENVYYCSELYDHKNTNNFLKNTKNVRVFEKWAEIGAWTILTPNRVIIVYCVPVYVSISIVLHIHHQPIIF